MFTVVTNIRANKVLWKDGHHSMDGHHEITTFFTVLEFGSQKFLPATYLDLEDDLWWNLTFGGRGPLVEDDFQWKTTFSGRRPSLVDNLRR